MIKAIIFDFDGLMLDTEGSEFRAWSEIYAEYGAALHLADWAAWIGGTGESDFHPLTHLQGILGRELDGEALNRQAHARARVLNEKLAILPGVLDYLDDARRLGLRLAVASSSPYSWVSGHLTRLGLLDRFEAIRTADDVPRTKPDPALFLAALEALNIAPEEAIVLEDSPNGALAAQRAGIFVVAVPNPLTAQLDLSHADLRLESLAALSLPELLRRVENGARVQP